MTGPGPQIHSRALPSRTEMIERPQMSFGQILDVDVIANSRSIGRLIVGPIDVDMRAFSERGVQDQWNEVRFGFMSFADFAFAVGSGSVEIALRHRSQAIGLVIPSQRPLDRELSFAIGVDRQLRSGFLDRDHLGHAVGRASR